jgi:hypothetical protein
MTNKSLHFVHTFATTLSAGSDAHGRGKILCKTSQFDRKGMYMYGKSMLSSLAAIPLMLAGIAAAQDHYQQRTLVINGHTGTAMLYQIDGRSYVALETIAQIANGGMSFSGDKIILTIPAGDSAVTRSSDHAAVPGMSTDFMKAAIQELAILKDWSTTLATGIQRGAPGDGSRLVVFHDGASTQLRLARVAASNESDESALRLLTNHFNVVNNWSDKLVAERKSMNTAKYSMTPNALANDETYQKITGCAQFLGTMIPSGQFQEGRACN